MVAEQESLAFCSNFKLDPILNRFIIDFNRILIEDQRLRTNSTHSIYFHKSVPKIHTQRERTPKVGRNKTKLIWLLTEIQRKTDGQFGNSKIDGRTGTRTRRADELQQKFLPFPDSRTRIKDEQKCLNSWGEKRKFQSVFECTKKRLFSTRHHVSCEKRNETAFEIHSSASHRTFNEYLNLD